MLELLKVCQVVKFDQFFNFCSEKFGSLTILLKKIHSLFLVASIYYDFCSKFKIYDHLE